MATPSTYIKDWLFDGIDTAGVVVVDSKLVGFDPVNFSYFVFQFTSSAGASRMKIEKMGPAGAWETVAAAAIPGQNVEVTGRWLRFRLTLTINGGETGHRVGLLASVPLTKLVFSHA